MTWVVLWILFYNGTNCQNKIRNEAYHMGPIDMQTNSKWPWFHLWYIIELNLSTPRLPNSSRTHQLGQVFVPRQKMVAPHMQFKGFGTSSGGGGGAGEGPPEPKAQPKKKAVPLSKKLSSNIATCSQKLTEILGWQSKLKDNTAGLLLADALAPQRLICYFFLCPHIRTSWELIIVLLITCGWGFPSSG
jgi:hypothetical protein